MEQLLRRTWAEIDLDALQHNYETLTRRMGVPLVGVVKADAYGHGAIWVARALEEMGAAAEHLTQDEKMHVVAQLDSQGVFLLKGAVRDVAERLHCSQASVYRYLTRIRGQHDRKE